MTTEQQAREALSIEEALLRAYALGQAYWQQADSESYAQNRRAEDTKAKFKQLLSDVVNQAAEDKRIADAVRGADAAFVHDDNEIVHTDDCDPKHYGNVLIIPASVLEGE